MNMSLRKRPLLLFLMIIIALCVSILPARADEADDPLPDNGLPVVYINIDESQGTIEDMIESEDHSVYCYGSLSIDVPEGFHYSDFPDAACESVSELAMSIRGRGNSTWVRNEKKPFKIKLDKKAELFGMGKNKHWALIANASDYSLLRDRISAWLGDQFGFDFTPRGVPVDLVMRGDQYGEKYLGSYYFTETVRIDDNRIEIDELEEDDTEYPDITGGYLLKCGNQEPKDSPDVFYTKREILLATDTPSFAEDDYHSPAQQEYIRNHIDLVEDTVFAEGTAYRDLIDAESAARYWLFQDFCKNFDAWVTGSTYFYKKRDVNGVTGRIFFGPLWDFDFAWDYGYGYTGHINMFKWMEPMFRDKEPGGFADEIKKQWPVFRESIERLIADGGVIDQYYEETKRSAEADRLINFPDDTDFDYLQYVTTLKEWIRSRLAWYDADFVNTDQLIHKVWFMCDDQEVSMHYVMHGKHLDTPPAPVEKEGYIFLGWYDEDGNNTGTGLDVTKDMVITAQFISEDEATIVEDIALRKDSDVILYSPRFNMYMIAYSLVPLDAQDQRIEWVSSDESIASVDEDGMVTTYGSGTVTLTAVMKNGNRRDFTLYILENGDIPKPESVFPTEDIIYMKPGQQLPLYIDTVPSPAKINDYEYASEDEEVVTVSEHGVLTAGKTGETKVRVTAILFGDDYSDKTELQTEVTVIVEEKTEPEPEPGPEPTPEPEPAQIVYTAVSGDTYSYTKGSPESISITVKRSEGDESCFAHFTGVKTDGNELRRDTDYTAVSGSTVITLKAAYLETLKPGSHVILAGFDDGEVSVTLNITEGEKKNTPDTSDHTRTDAYTALLGISLLVFAAALLIKKKAG